MRALIAAFVLLSDASVQAAEIAMEPAKVGDAAAIHITGDIVSGDLERLQNLAQQTGRRVTVWLSSRGGAALDAVDMGNLINQRGWSTYVPPNSICASACGLIWVAGVSRTIAADSRVGFHAVYRGDDPTHPEYGAANAIVGAYLSGLGFKYYSIVYMTSAAPSQMAWLDASTVNENRGIWYQVERPSNVASAPTTAASQSGVPPPSSSSSVAKQPWLGNLVTSSPPSAVPYRKAVAHARPAPEQTDQHPFDPTDISRLLSKEAPQ